MAGYDIAALVLLAALALIWAIYVHEAFRKAPEQGLLVLLVPGYVYYFAHVQSRRAWPLRVALMLLTMAFVVSSGLGVLAGTSPTG